jgi:glycosyltransferase involved in cell wall biosynthesis
VRTLRVLHVVAQMRPGGIETWLLEVLRRIDRQRFQLDFLVHTDQPQTYDDEIRSLGSRVIPCLAAQRPWQYATHFRRALAANGPYDVIHSHMHLYSGFILRLAAQAGVPVRIAHSHTDTRPLVASSGWLRRQYAALMQRWLARYATLGVGCSGQAVESLFGGEWRSDPRWRIYYCGVAMERFAQPVDKAAVRAELGIPAGRKVIGHVGRFEPLKNHAMIVETARELRRRRDDMHFLLVGAGDLHSTIEQQVAAAGLSDCFSLPGARNDVPRILRGAMDAFMFPSFREGLGLALVEAQAAGLPAAFTEAISPEVELVPSLMHRLPREATAADWARQLEKMLDDPPTIEPSQALSIVGGSHFNIDQGVRELERMYRDGRP